MAREVKDTRESGAQVAEEAPVPRNPLQIHVSPSMERMIVEIVREDHSTFKRARNKRDYGRTAKGEDLSFQKWIDGLRDLYNGKREAKTVPWKFCSNRSLRIAASILDMLHSRFYAGVVNEDLVRWWPGKTVDKPKVEKITKFMHWWVWVHSKLRPFYDNWIKIVLGYGDGLTETSWKVRLLQTGKPIHEPVTDESGAPLANPDGTPAIVRGFEPDRFEFTKSKTYMQDQFLLQEGSEDIRDESLQIMDEIMFKDLEKGEAEGKFVNVGNLLKSRIMSEMKVDPGMSDDERDAVLEARLRNHPVKIIREYMHFDADGDGFAEDVHVFVSLDHDLYLGGMRVADITEGGERPLDFTKLESRLEAPSENWGLGIIEKVRELAEEIDAIFNQASDGNTLSVMNPGFYDPGGDLDAPTLQLAPNKITPVSDPSRSLFFPTINIPTEKLLLQIRLVLEFIERLTAASSFVLGKQDELAGGSGTATRTQAILQSAEQRFATPAERLREGASHILKNHLNLVQKNIPPGLEDKVLGQDGEPVFSGNELTKEGISGQFTAYILADPSMGSKQTERELSSMFYSILLNNVIVGTDPAKIYKVTADFIKAHGKDPVEYLGPAPDMDDIDTPEDENTLLLQGDFTRVVAQITENHLEHIRVHQDLLQSEGLAALAQTTPELFQQVVQEVQRHIQEHVQQMQVMIQIQQSFGGGGGGAAQGQGNGNGRAKGPNGQGVPGSGGQSRLEQVPGALGAALSAKREGQSGGPSGP